ncbi:unnamed protein product [marine sediment metagenome]|uniref:Uncharacterized protein n=1 Tax=marine sediment metagenome TaxID=412755 RepID=X1D4W9_9ZZZZ
MKFRWLVVFAVAVGIFILLDFFLVSGHAHNALPWSHITGFFSLFGFIGCLILIGFAKLIGHYWLQRKEDYYDRNDDDE